MSEDYKSDGNKALMNKRNLLRNMAVLGTLSTAPVQVGASSSDKNGEVDTILDHDKVKKLVGNIPDIELKPDDATIFGKNDSLVVIPSNYGKLLVTTTNTVAASFYFEEWVPNVDDAWPKGTEARLTVTDDEVLLQRSATDAEKRKYLSSINRPDLHENNTKIAVIPEQGEISFTNVNRNKRKIETITAVSQQGVVDVTQQQDLVGKNHTEIELQVVDNTTYTSSNLTTGSEVSTSAECDDEILIDLAICAADYAECGLCTMAGVAGPVSIACWIIVCLDGGLSIAMELLADWGCLEAGKGGYACLQYAVDEYADAIPF